MGNSGIKREWGKASTSSNLKTKYEFLGEPSVFYPLHLELCIRTVHQHDIVNI
jgi:hypothetical protein